MELIHLNDWIIGAIAQKPFKTKTQNYIFDKVIPLLNRDDYNNPILNQDEFYNDGEIWWYPNRMPQSLIPGSLICFCLEAATGCDPFSQDSSLYQVANGSRIDTFLGVNNGAEVFTLQDETTKCIERLKDEKAYLVLPHAPSKMIFLRVEGKVFGPYITYIDESSIQDGNSDVRVSLKPDGNNRTIYRVADEKFKKIAKTFSLEVQVSLNEKPSKKTDSPSLLKYEIILPHELEKIKQSFLNDWDKLDYESLSTKFGRLIRGSKTFTRDIKKQIAGDIKLLEDYIANSDDPQSFRELISSLDALKDEAESNLKDILKIFYEAGLVDEKRKEEAEKSYLEEFIKTQSAKIQDAIFEKNKELFVLEQKLEDKRSLYEEEYEQKRKEKMKALKEEEDKRINALEAFVKEEKEKIKNEKNNWDAERKSRLESVEAREKAIQTMLETIESKSEEDMNRIIDIYPYLKYLKNNGELGIHAVSETNTEEINNKPFPLPQILVDGRKDALIDLAETDFFQAFTKYAQSKGYQYEEKDLRRFHNSVKCGNITILAGPSGVGKSSLAILYGDCLAGSSSEINKTLMIQVSPSWMEKSDIIGYVNTITNDFTPAATNLYQQLIYAQEDYKNNNENAGIYPICLDEMNLAQVEYYFSDFLQILELKQDNRILSCFSKEAIKEDSQFAGYHRLTIVPTIRFIGTVNFDETTKNLSARLLDRTSLIYLNSSKMFDMPSSDSQDDLGVRGPIPYAVYQKWVRVGALSPDIIRFISDIDSDLRVLGGFVSPRIRSAMSTYIASAQSLLPENSYQEIAFDEFFAQRILSKVRSCTLPKQLEALKSIRTKLYDFCEAEQSQKILSKLEEEAQSIEELPVF